MFPFWPFHQLIECKFHGMNVFGIMGHEPKGVFYYSYVMLIIRSFVLAVGNDVFQACCNLIVGADLLFPGRYI